MFPTAIACSAVATKTAKAACAARRRVPAGGPPHPKGLPAAPLFLAQELRQDRVVHRPLTRYFRLHEAELVGAVTAAEEAFGVHENALAAVFFRAHCYGLSLAHLARLRRHQVALGVAHDDAIHTWQARAGPGAGGFDVGR